MAAMHQLFQRLPEELIQEVLESLDQKSLQSLNLTSRWCYQVATPLIWREVRLQDCRTDRVQFGNELRDDHHDDTPLLRKLLIIAKNPWIGSCVTTLQHNCHLPPPAIFHELPRTPLCGSTLSPDWRTAKLVQLAVKNMPNVTTLRIIFGHPNLNDALLRCFFDKRRPPSIRRLWLENCRISAGCDLQIACPPLQLPRELDFTGLESIRFRRLPIRPAMSVDKAIPILHYNHARTGSYMHMQNGAGSEYQTPFHHADLELRANTRSLVTSHSDILILNSIIANMDFVNECDARIFNTLGQEEVLPQELMTPFATTTRREGAYVPGRGPYLDPDFNEATGDMPELTDYDDQRERKPSSRVMTALINNCSATLTNLCLDWVFTKPYEVDPAGWTQTFLRLFSLRFPNLKSFQFRNAVVINTEIPKKFHLMDWSDIYEDRLITDEESGRTESAASSYPSLCGLEFMEAHPNLQCLAWPMESFFYHCPPEPRIAARQEAVIDNLGRTLVDLRVDTMYNWTGESQSEAATGPDRTRDRRYRFINEFAAKMSKVESIKIEGGVPRDERREVIRALHRCPLTKIVMIGVCSPIGNTWGAAGRDVGESLDSEEVGSLEGEHKDSINRLGFTKPEAIPANFKFVPSYGWPPQPPIIHTIASYHAETVRELKFCGYKGAPVLFNPTSITHPMVAALKHFHALESIIMSMWFNTMFEEEHRDDEIIKYWLEARSPTSTSLVRITDEEPEGWEKELCTKYAPRALACWVTGFLGQYLSERAKARPGGVHVRVSMCIGEFGGIFDMDLRIGKGILNSDVCLGFEGPREELEPKRRQQKLESRRWF